MLGIRVVLLLLVVFLEGAISSVFAGDCSMLESSAYVAQGKARVAAVQYPVENGKSLAEFLQKMDGYFYSARRDGAELVVFPELAILDMVRREGAASETEQLRTLARETTPAILEHLVNLAKTTKTSILGGTVPRLTDRGIVNSAALALADGRLILQDKLFLTPDEVVWGWVPGQELRVFDAPWGKTAILICYDCEVPLVSNTLAPSMPEVILIPSMTGADGLRRVATSAWTRAVEHHALVVVTGTVDGVQRPGVAADYCGQAAIFTPCETGFPGIQRQGTKDSPGLLVDTLDLTQLRRSRAVTGIYPARDQLLRVGTIRVVDEPR